MSKNYNLIFILTFSIFSCSKSGTDAPKAPPAVPVVLDEVTKSDAVYYDYYPGNIIALNEVQLRSQVSGFVTRITFQEGKTVKKGQKLYEIDRTKYAAVYQQALANLAVAKSNVEKSQKDAERFTELGKRDAVARQRVEYALTDFQNTRQQVNAAQAQVENAVADLQRSDITAPFDGTIGISQVKLGAYVTSGQTLLNTISSNDPMSVDFVISEKEISRFTAFSKSPAIAKDSLFTISFSGGTIYPYPGTISIFDRAVDPQTGTLKIRLNFPNPDGDLKSGMSCQVRILNKTGNNAVLVLNKAVTEQMGEYFIYVVKNDTAHQQKVIPGQTVGDRIVIKEGLVPGEIFVVEGIQKLKEGVAVQKDTTTKPSINGQPLPTATINNKKL